MHNQHFWFWSHSLEFFLKNLHPTGKPYQQLQHSSRWLTFSRNNPFGTTCLHCFNMLQPNSTFYISSISSWADAFHAHPFWSLRPTMMNCSRDNAVRDNLRYSTHELGDDGWDTNADSLLFVPGGFRFIWWSCFLWIYTEITEIMILMTDACNIQKSVHNLVEL